MILPKLADVVETMKALTFLRMQLSQLLRHWSAGQHGSIFISLLIRRIYWHCTGVKAGSGRCCAIPSEMFFPVEKVDFYFEEKKVDDEPTRARRKLENERRTNTNKTDRGMNGQGQQLRLRVSLQIAIYIDRYYLYAAWRCWRLLEAALQRKKAGTVRIAVTLYMTRQNKSTTVVVQQEVVLVYSTGIIPPQTIRTTAVTLEPNKRPHKNTLIVSYKYSSSTST